jgi:hypothetical protein
MLIDVISNGHTKEQRTPEVETITFSTGVTVTVRPLATMTVQLINAAVRKDPAFHRPDPPMQKVEAIDGATTVQNAADPAYVAALKEWEQRVAEEVGARFLKVLARRAVEIAVDAAWVAAFRADMDAAGAPIEGDDAEVYLYHYAAPLAEDMELLQRKALRQSQPTEAAISEHTDTFRGDVSRP